MLSTKTLVLTLAISSGASHAQIELTRLGALADRNDSIAFDINDNGQVVGQSFNDRGVLHAFMWDSGVMTDLDPSNPDTPSNAWALNDHGVAVGYIDGRDGFEAMRWSGGSGTNLDAQNGALGPSQIFDINNDGAMVGGFSLDGGFTKPTVLDSAGNVTDTLMTNMFKDGGFMRGINSQGTVVGHDFFFGTPDDAMFANPDDMGGYETPTALPEQLGNDPFPFTLAYDVNDSGVIAGTSNNGTGDSEAAMWTPNGDGTYQLHLFGTIDGQQSAIVWGVNASGVGVGQSYDLGGETDPNAFIIFNGQMIDLNDFLMADEELLGAGFTHLLGAHAINDAGDIVGFGWTVDGTREGFVMRGVPAPGAGALLATALLAVTRRKR